MTIRNKRTTPAQLAALFRLYRRRFLTAKNIRKRLVLICVYVPTLLAAMYLFLFHSNMYISESHFALRSGDSGEISAIQGILFPSAGGTASDAHVVLQYITSGEMLQQVNSRIDLKKHYADKSRDILSRLKSTPTKEEFLRYWQGLIDASYDIDRGIISVEVKAYSPEMAQEINQAILVASEGLINEMNKRAHLDAMQLAHDEVDRAEKRLLHAQISLQQFRDDHAILDPAATAEGLEKIVAALEGEASAVQAELNTALLVMKESSPRITSLRTKLSGISEQIQKEKARLAGLDTNRDPLSSLVGSYTTLIAEEKFSQHYLTQAMGALEAARIKAMAQSRYIVPFQPPSLPEESLYPKPFLFSCCIFLSLLVGLGICSLIIAAVKDHMGV